MPNELQRATDSLLKTLPFTNCCKDDILVASKESLGEQKAIVMKVLIILDENNMALGTGK